MNDEELSPRERLNSFCSDRDIEHAMGERTRPPNWRAMSSVEKLDHVATRLLAEDRKASGLTSHNALKDSGILSTQQYDRRRAREVYGSRRSLETIVTRRREFGQGVFGRAASPNKGYKDPERLRKIAEHGIDVKAEYE